MILYYPENKAKFHPAYKGALDLEYSMAKELQQQYHLKDVPEIDLTCRRLQVLLNELRTFCYRLLHFGMVMMPDFYNIVSTELSYTSIFQHLPHCDAFQMRLFMRHFGSHYFTLCSKESLPSLEPLLAQFLNYMNGRVTAEWESLEKTSSDKQEDILKDKLVRIISVEYAQVLKDLTVPNDKNFTEKPLTTLGNHIIQNPKLFEIYLNSFLFVMKIPDTSCKRIIIDLTRWILPSIMRKCIYNFQFF